MYLNVTKINQKILPILPSSHQSSVLITLALKLPSPESSDSRSITDTYTLTHMFAHTIDTRTHIHTHAQTLTHSLKYTYTHTCMHAYTHTCSHTHALSHTCARASGSHTHLCPCLRVPLPTILCPSSAASCISAQHSEALQSLC